MTFVRNNESAFSDTRTRSQKLTPCSGMCSFCTEDCAGTCADDLIPLTQDARMLLKGTWFDW